MTTILKSKTTRAITAVIKIKGDLAANDDTIQNLVSRTNDETDLRKAEGMIVGSIRSLKTGLEKLRIVEDEWMSFIAKLPKDEKEDVEVTFVAIAEKEDGLFEQQDDMESFLEILEDNLETVFKTIQKLSVSQTRAVESLDALMAAHPASPAAQTAAPVAHTDAHIAAPTAAPSAAPSAAHTAANVALGPTTRPIFNEPSTGFQIKLPQMQLGTFSGNPRDWPRFWNTFDACVDSRAVPEIVKLNYLISCLTDSAAEAVKGYDVCSENYLLVKNTLLDRFGNEEKIVEQLYRELHSLRAPGESRSEARKFVDDLEAILHQLERRNLNTNDVPTMMAVEKILPKWMKPYIFTMKMSDPNLSMTKLRTAMKSMVQISLEDEGRNDERNSYTTMAVVNSHQPKKFQELNKGSKPKQSYEKFEPKRDEKKSERCVLCSKHAKSHECRTYETLEKRKSRIKELNLCFRCNTAGHRSADCRKKIEKCRCGKMHNPVLCFPRNEEKTTTVAVATSENVEIEHLVAHVASDPEVALMTIDVILENSVTGKKVKTLAFFDSGAQMSFITNELADAMQLSQKKKENMDVKIFSGPTRSIQYSRQSVTLLESNGQKREMAVKSIDNIVPSMKSVRIAPNYADGRKLNHPAIISETRKPHIIVGNDYFWSIVQTKIEDLENGFEVIGSTVGPMLAGSRPATNHHSSVVNVITSVVTPAIVDNQLDDLLKESFELDTLGIKDSPDVNDDEIAWELFEKSVKFEDGRYVCSLPWKDVEPNLPTNEGLAFSQLQACKSRFTKRPDLITALKQIIDEWIDKEIIEKVPEEEKDCSEGLVHYLPYHIVETPNKNTTKKRLVHNASAKTKGNPSLNELLYRGPVILPDLAGLMLRFREYKEVVIGDLEKAFLQLTLNPKDRDVLRFLYPQDWEKPLDRRNVDVLRFKRVNFGVISSPFLLAGTIRVHLKKYNTPLDQEMLLNTYVDNVLLEANDASEADEKAKAAHARFNEATMNLREFVSSNEEFNKKWCSEVPQEVSFLGLKWSPSEDTVRITIPQLLFDNPTKRKILQKTASVFDPLGLVSPALLPFRIFIQDLWKTKKGWDQQLEIDQKEALKLLVEKDAGATICLPRRIINNNHFHELHIFVDASKKAFAGCAYLKDLEEMVPPQLIFAKTRLAPIKEVSIPRLELVALEIGTRLKKFIKSQISSLISSTTIWSDSQCVLSWIKSKKESLPRFVTNRIKKIEESDATFNYIGTKSNPADVASRGCSSTALQQDNLWWHGPEWLGWTPDKWPEQPANLFELDTREETKKIDADIVMNAIVSKLPEQNSEALTVDPTRFSAWKKMENVTVKVIKFGRIMKGKISKISLKAKESFGRDAERFLLRECQARHPPTADQVRQLRLYLDEDNLWRSRGRLDNSDIDFTMKNPIYLSKKDHTTKLIVMKFHLKHQHARPNHTLAQLRTEFWIPQARTLVKKVLKEMCMKCRRELAKPYKAPEMPPLPSVRVTPAPPFQRTGVDYAGPFNVRQKSSIIKTWICLFTCLVTRVSHLELVTDVSSASFLTSLRRFVARRGRPNFLLSDNGTNFRGAFRAVTTEWTDKCDQDVITYCSQENMEWKFIPSLSPWFGGVYERVIGIMKRALSRAVGNRLLTYDQFWTLVTETEAVINSRPLVHVTEEHRALRPIDFIMPNASIGVPSSAEDAEEEYKETRTTSDRLTSQWRQSLKILDIMWNSWHTEYFSSLRERYNFELKQGRRTARKEPEIGEVVILADGQQKRGHWKLATIDSIPESQKGAVRSVVVRTSNGRRLHRAIAQIYPLEIRPPAQEISEIQQPAEEIRPEQENYETFESDNISVPHQPQEDRYNLRQRKNKPSYVFFMLALLSILGQVNAGTCPKGKSLTRIYQQECMESGIVVHKINETSYCWERVNCVNQHLKRWSEQDSSSRVCGPRCSCPDGALGCTFHNTRSNLSMEKLNSWLNGLRPVVCSYSRTKECPVEVYQQVHQVELEDGSRRYVSNLNIVRKQSNREEKPVCFGQGKITGTPEYCAHSPCSKNGTQYCVVSHSEFAYLVTQQGDVPITAWFSENRTVFERRPLKADLESPGCNKIKIECSDEGVNLALYKCIPDAIEVCLNNSTPQKCRFFDYVSALVTVSLPASELLTDYNVDVKLWDKGILQHRAGVSCTRKDVCVVANCLICWSIYFHPHCFLENIGRAIVHTLALIAAGFLIVSLLWRICRNRPPCRLTLYRRRRWMPTRLADKIILMSVAMLCFFPTPASACSNIISFQANDSSCLLSPNGQMCCSYNQVTSVTMTTDSEACILLKDADNRPMGTLHLTVKSRMICQKKNIFYTTPIDIKTAFSKRCPGMGLCTGQTCSLLNPTDQVPELAAFQNFAGKNFCEESCSCFTCGCLSCAAACMFYRIYAVPVSKDMYSTFQCDWILENEVLASLHTSIGIQTQHFKLPPGGTSKGDTLTIGVQSAARLYDFDHKARFIQHENRIAYLSQFGKKTTEVFRCEREKVDNQTCHIKEDACYCRQADSGDTCFCTDNKLLQKELKKNALPHFMLGTVLENRNNQVQTSIDAVVTLAVKAEDLIGQTQVELSICKMEKVTLQGCFACDAGAQIDYLCVTDFGRQLAHINCETFQFTANCDTTSVIRRTTAKINTGQIKESCNISCPGSIKNFNVQGQLFFVSAIDQWTLKDRSMVEGRSLLQMAREWIQTTTDNLKKLLITMILFFVFLKLAKFLLKKIIIFLF